MGLKMNVFGRANRSAQLRNIRARARTTKGGRGLIRNRPAYRKAVK